MRLDNKANYLAMQMKKIQQKLKADVLICVDGKSKWRACTAMTPKALTKLIAIANKKNS